MENQEKEVTEPKKIGDKRNPDGTFAVGNPGGGRPKGAGISITTEIKRKLEEVPPGQKSTYLQILIDRILKQAIVDGDQQMIKNIWNYVDGMPKQTLGIDDDVHEVNVRIIKNGNQP